MKEANNQHYIYIYISYKHISPRSYSPSNKQHRLHAEPDPDSQGLHHCTGETQDQGLCKDHRLYCYIHSGYHHSLYMGGSGKFLFQPIQ